MDKDISKDVFDVLFPNHDFKEFDHLITYLSFPKVHNLNLELPRYFKLTINNSSCVFKVSKLEPLLVIDHYKIALFGSYINSRKCVFSTRLATLHVNNIQDTDEFSIIPLSEDDWNNEVTKLVNKLKE